MASDKIEYTHCLQSAIDRFKDICSLTDWSLIKTETVTKSNTSLKLWKNNNIVKVDLNENQPYNLCDWRSILETDGPYGWHQMVEKRQVITRLDKHTSVCKVKMKDKWEIGSKDRIVIEQVIQHTNSLRYYSIGVEQDDLLQMVCLDIQSRTNQTNQYYHVTCYLQWKIDAQSTPPTHLFEDYMLSMITASLTTLGTCDPIPYISRQDLGIDIGLNEYDSTMRTLKIEYQYQPHLSDNIDVNTNIRAKSPTIDIQKSILPSLHSRSWGQQELLLSSSYLRKNEFMSSSLRLNPSSPGSYARNIQGSMPLSRKLSFTSSDKNNYVSSSLLFTSDISKKGSQLDIEFDGSTTSVAHLQLRLFYANGEEIDSLVVNQFTQLCLRCFRHSDIACRYTLALQHPTTLIDDLKLSEDTLLTIHLTLKLEKNKKGMGYKLDSMEGSSNKVDASSSSLIQLFLNEKQWPVRDSMPWDIAVNNSEDDSDNDIDDQRQDSTTITSTEKDKIDDEQELNDPFMSSMEDIHELNKVKQQNDPPPTIFPTRASMPNILVPSPTKPIHHDTVPILKKSSSVTINELSKSSTPIGVRPSKPSLTFVDNQNNKSTQHILENDKNKTLNNASDTVKKSKPMPIEIKKEKSYKRPLSSGKKIIIHHADPPVLSKAYQYMDTLLHSDNWQITQKPEQSNGFATIKKMDVEGHPTGAFFCECVWHHCSIWDVKAVLNCSEAREIWDPMFEKGEFICSVTPSCSIWHSKLKGAWPASPRDYVAFTSQYTSPQRIDICSTSCIGDTYEYYTLPKETSEYVRAKLDLSGWRLDYMDSIKKTTVSVRYVLQTHFQGWIPWYLLNQLTTQAPNVPTSAYQFFKKHGAPPSLEELELATMQQLRYDHIRKHWRCEYSRSITMGEEGPTKSTVRLDRRRWAYFSSQYNNGTDSSHYNVTIDPPPSSVIAQVRKDDPYGVWLMIEHDESFIIPIRAKILVLIKPNLPLQQVLKQKQQQQQQLPKKQRKREVSLVVNGVTKPIENDHSTLNDELDSFDIDENEKSISSNNNNNGNGNNSIAITSSPTASPNSSTAFTSSVPISPSTSSTLISDDKLLEQYIQQLSITPMEQAQAAFLFLKRMDEQFGWTVVSDKQGLRINKRSGSKVSASKEKNELNTALPTSSSSSSLKDRHYLDVPEPYVIYKASKVIEKYSTEEVASVITNISDSRLAYDSSVENCSVIEPIQRGCQIVRQEIKSVFPFKSRELYMVSCTAIENICGPPSSQRILYVESSLDISILKSSKLPRGKMFVSGWLLEPIDPYTTATNHPIPSMRATYIVALDLGTSIPSYISNMVANGIASKKIQWVERYLKERGPLPYLIYPLPAAGLKNNKCVDIQLLDKDRNSNNDTITTDSMNDKLDGSKNDTDDNERSNMNQSFNKIAMASKTTMITTGTRMATMKWRDVQAIYSQQPLIKVVCQCQYQQPKQPSSSFSTSNAPPISSSTPVTIPTASSLHIQPIASQSASWIDRRYSTTSSSTHSLSHQRRGSLPSSTLTTTSSSSTTTTSSSLASAALAVARQRKLEMENEKKNNINNNINSPTIISNNNNMIIDPILSEIVVDLQTFPKGYDVMVQFYQQSDGSSDSDDAKEMIKNEKDLSGLLCVNISELTPTPSYLLLTTDSSNKTPPPGKHLVQIKLLSSLLSQTIFQPKDKDIFNLTISLQHHVQEKKSESATQLSTGSYINNASDRLTVSSILGEDDEEDESDNNNKRSMKGNGSKNNASDKKEDDTTHWHGHVYVDGKKVLNYGKDIKISRAQQDSPLQSLYNSSSPSSTVSINNHLDGSPNVNENAESLLLQQLQSKQKNNTNNNFDMDERDKDDTDTSSLSSSYSTSTDDDTSNIPGVDSPYQGVVAAALGGVTGFRMRMLFPFQNSAYPSRNIQAPQKTITVPSTTNDNDTSIQDMTDLKENEIKIETNDNDINTNDSETKEKRNRRRTATLDGTKPQQSKNNDHNNTTFTSLNIVNPTSTMNDGNNTISLTNWNVILWIIVISLCIVCVVTLLLLQPRLVTFDPQSPIYSLIRLPWFKGWELHLIISKSSSLT